jgi:hypothetical protein
MKTDALPPEVQRELDAIDAALAGEPVAPELTELGALALALRDERPEADPFFHRKLDTAAEAGFPRPPRWSRIRGLLGTSPMLLPGVAASVLLALLVSVALLSSGEKDQLAGSGSSTSGASTALQEDSTSSSSGAGSTAGGSSGAGAVSGSRLQDSARQKSSSPEAGSGVGVPAPVPPVGGGGSPSSDRRAARKVERSASMTLVAQPRQLDTVADRIVQAADANRGFVVSSSVNRVENGGGGEFLLRVPSARLDTVLAQLSRLAHVRERQQATQDITAQHTSARDRLGNAQAERRGLLRRLARAVTDAQVASIKAQLRDVSGRIEAAKADLARISNRASFSNVAVSLVADPRASAIGSQGGDNRWSPGDAARDAVRVLEVAAGVALIALAIGVPLGFVILAGVLTARLAARRGRRRALDAL